MSDYLCYITNCYQHNAFNHRGCLIIVSVEVLTVSTSGLLSSVSHCVQVASCFFAFRINEIYTILHMFIFIDIIY